jgi:hypothetical protein
MGVTIDKRFPEMSPSSAVFPTVRISVKDMVLAYHLPGCQDSAVVVFRGIRDWSYGHPNDEGLHLHPLWGRGLDYYAFHCLGANVAGEICWLATFHDGLFEVCAAASEILCDRVKGCSPWEALDAVAGPGDNRVLDDLTGS